MPLGPYHTLPASTFAGILLVLAATFAISLQDVIFKAFGNTMTLWQIFALRGALAIPLFLMLRRPHGAGIFVQAFQPWVMLRAWCMTLTFLAFYAAIPFLSLSTLGAANYMAPIFVALLSAFAIRERVTWRGWLAVLIGFAGVLVLLRPGTDAFSVWALLPLTGAMFYACGHILTRTKCRDVPVSAMALAVILATMCAGILGSLIISLAPPGTAVSLATPYLLGGWSPLDLAECLILAALTLLTVAATLLLAGAYKAAPPSTAATFEYSYLVFVALWDMVFFATPPGGMTLLGMAMIVGAGLLLIYRHPQKTGSARPPRPDR